MKLALVGLLLIGLSAIAQAEPQFYPDYVPRDYYFRADLPGPSVEIVKDPKSEGRLFFTTLSLFFSTSTSTTVSTSVVTCTTSTAGLSVCTPSGRRRRGVFLNNKEGRGLFYDEQENQGDDIGSIFLPSEPK